MGSLSSPPSASSLRAIGGLDVIVEVSIVFWIKEMIY